MQFLADESCDFAVVRALRAADHDVAAVAELAPAADDQTVLDLAIRDSRILLTEDKDFGQLFFAAAQPSGTVILIRFAARARNTLPGAVVEFIAQSTDLTGCFVVLHPGLTRITRAPGAGGSRV